MTEELMNKKKGQHQIDVALILYGVPKGIRTPVAAVKGQCPRPLDDGDIDWCTSVNDQLQY